MPLNFARIHQLAKPTFANGKWVRPELSLRKLRVLKKLSAIAGAKWEDPPSLINKPNPIRAIPRPGNKHDRLKPLRIQKTKELLEGQQRLWAQQNKTRRDKLKAERDKEWDPLMEMRPELYVKMPKPPATDIEATRIYHAKVAAKAAKEKRWAEMLKGAEQKKESYT